MFEPEYKKGISLMVVVLLVVVSVYFTAKTVSVAMSDTLWGSSIESTITLSGHGEANAVPDVASVYFTIRKEGKTSKEAQDAVTELEGKALDALKLNNIEDKNIKTENVSVYPKYDYKYEATLQPCNEYGCPPRTGKNVLVGYEASETVKVKITDLDNTGKVMEALTNAGVGELNGPNFEVDDEEAVKALARKEAIDEARQKAEVLARDLGVRLGKVTSFNESGNYPMYYAKDVAMGGAMAESASSAPALPKGENTITSDVTITYEIK